MTDFRRADGRAPLELRPTRITTGFTQYAEGSVLIEVGATRIICTASVEERVPPFLKGKGAGWVTAEYASCRARTETRTDARDGARRASGRTHEIQRLVGRKPGSVVDMPALGERTVTIDCDVIKATAGRAPRRSPRLVALALALKRHLAGGKLARSPLRDTSPRSASGSSTRGSARPQLPVRSRAPRST